MKIGIISDVHGNMVALKAVLEEIKNCDLVLNAGDLTGYYPAINEAIEVLKGKKFINIRGNHDRYLLRGELPSGLGAMVNPSFRYNLETITPANLKFLAQLPDSLVFEFDGQKIGLFHGSPAEPETYVYPDSDLDFLSNEPYNLIVLGHTHWPMIKKVGSVIVVNPGSMGQPRDPDKRASYAILETRDLTIKLARKEFDKEKVCAEVKEKKLPLSLCQILKEKK